MITEFPLWYDVSSHQGTIRYARLAEAKEKVYGVYIRAGVGLNKDVQFERNWEKCGDYGLYRASYWALYPQYSPDDQLLKWFDICPEIDGIPRVLDLEVGGGITPQYIAEIVEHVSDAILHRDGLRPWIYSRTNLIEKWLVPYWLPEDLNIHFYILAQYDDGDGVEYDGLVVPEGVHIDRILIKQTSDEIPPDPLSLAPECAAIDRNRWLPHDVDGMNDYLVSVYFGGTKPVDCCEELKESFDAHLAYMEGWRAGTTEGIRIIATEIAEHEDNIEAINTNIIKTQNNIRRLKADMLRAQAAIDASKEKIDGMEADTHASLEAINNQLKLDDEMFGIHKGCIEENETVGNQNWKAIEEMDKRIDDAFEDITTQAQETEYLRAAVKELDTVICENMDYLEDDLNKRIDLNNTIIDGQQKQLSEISNALLELELQNNHVHPAWMRKIGLLKQED